MGMMYETFDYVWKDDNKYTFEIGELVSPSIDLYLVLTEEHKTDKNDPALNLYLMPKVNQIYTVRQRCFSWGVEYIAFSNYKVIHYPAGLFKSMSNLN